MKILRTIEVNFDEVAECHRIMNSFTATTRDNLLLILRDFVAGNWESAWNKYQNIKRADRECMHPFLLDCLTSFASVHHFDGATQPKPQPRSPYYHSFGFDRREIEPGYPAFSVQGRAISPVAPKESENA